MEGGGFDVEGGGFDIEGGGFDVEGGGFGCSLSLIRNELELEFLGVGSSGCFSFSILQLVKERELIMK